MKRPALLFTMLLLSCAAAGQEPLQRPHIFGIAGVTLYVSHADAARTFYEAALGPQQPSKHAKKHCFWCEKPPSVISNFDANSFQFLSVDRVPSPAPVCLIKDIGFHTDNVAALRHLLTAEKIEFWSPSVAKPKYLSLTDPEGHKIFFLETDGVLKDPENIAVMTKGGYKNEIIHAGFIVHDRAATEHFYKDILGFRPYWHGGMKDDQTDWVSMQVPDGTDWLEFMVNVSPDADQRVRGIMNHIAIGVMDIQATKAQLLKNGATLTEEPKLGRDGKWQLNVYDPDDTRVEFMEFTPKEKPCCSEFTGPHPKP